MCLDGGKSKSLVKQREIKLFTEYYYLIYKKQNTRCVFNNNLVKSQGRMVNMPGMFENNAQFIW